ncbi:Bax inhibitor-1/YccA family protein [Clostridium thermarum]|uniref:Bax inhibitor-1/YccA family protein n=1 Tax=Clostridium thermarum TaxID=1716543 RepID=UPI0013D0D7DE|nr:Bax inhibitor-1/YccA family protein [Clostridium thermarum]
MENSYVRSQNNFISKTLLTMALGLLVTFAVAVATPMFLADILTPQIIIAACAGEVIIVFYLSRRIEKLSIGSARMWFFAYSVLNGFTLSVTLAYYGFGQAAVAFGLSAAMFFSSAMIGMTTKKNLSTLGRVLIMGVVGLLLIALVQIIFPSAFAGMNLLIAFLGIAIFCGLTAYDMQQIKYFHNSSYAYDEVYASKFVIIAALNLYLDFINIFIYVLRLLKGDD